ncbi:lipocalin family protein [Formosa sp. S-31]|uniref:lipocalin family protein n=1 Tax=Formosa sp. S-31 TaxID=2790949 RepID=UPI003EC0F802
MKTLKLTCLFVLSMLFITSCSSDDDSTTEETVKEEPTLVGEWHGVASTYNGVDFGSPENYVINFNAENLAEFTYIGYGDNGEDIIREATYEINEGVLTIDWQGAYKDMETMYIKITELTEDTLVIEYNITLDGVITETYTR